MVTRERPAVTAVRPSIRPLGPYSPGLSTLLFACDITMFVLASILGAWIGSYHQVHHWDRQSELRLVAVQSLSIFLWVFIFHHLGLYRRSQALSMKDEIFHTGAALTIGVMPQLIIFTIVPAISPSRIALAASMAASFVLVSTTRALLRGVRDAAPRSRRRLAVVGVRDRISSTAEALELSESDDVLFIEVPDIDQSIAEIDTSGEIDLDSVEWLRQARAFGCSTLILTEVVSPDLMPHLLHVTARTQMRFAFAPPRIRSQSYSLSLQTEGHQALIVLSQLRACTAGAQVFKRLVDVPAALLGILLLWPIMLLAAIGILVESGGPVFYTQERVGLRGRVFRIFKFRSMRVDAEASTGAVWASDEDSRRTRVGTLLRRFSIDEFPQLFNVLRGDMSLVGPRPERPAFVNTFRKTLARYDERHLIRPGITGWSQIHMKRVLDPADAAEKLAYDLNYLEQWTPFLDISVLFQTLFEFPFHKAA